MPEILLLGDSLLSHSIWPISGYNPRNLSIGGYTIEEVAATQLPCAAALQLAEFAALVAPIAGAFLDAGINNATTMADDDDFNLFVTDYGATLDTLTHTVVPANRLLTFAPSLSTDPTGYVVATAGAVASLSAARGITCLSVASLLTDPANDYLDGKHWSPSGWAKLVPSVEQVLATWN